MNGIKLAARLSEVLDRRVCPSTVYKIQSGSRQPSAELFNALLIVLEVERDALLIPAPERAA